MTRRIQLAVLSAAFALTACGLPPTIDRTQPNFYKKSDFLQGSWYIKETVVDVPPTSVSATVGYGGELEKIRWEIHEDLLVGYRTYETVPGLDPRVDRTKSKQGSVVTIDGRPFKGGPVVAYSISSHFDRVRQYNSATGEQSNILTENTQDRPWYEREYFRVNWGKNQIENLNSILGRQSGKPMNIRYVTDQNANAQDDAVVTERDAEGQLSYMDFTVRAIVDPPTVYYEGYGDVPYCLLGGAASTVDCESAEVKIRVSMKRVDESRMQDYEPLQYTDRMMTKFGYFRNELPTYNKGYGFTVSGREQYAMRHNIWMAAHRAQLDAQGQPVKAADGTVVTETIPVQERQIRPIAYHLTSNFPTELLSAAKGLQTSWDKAFRRAVAVPRGVANDQVPQVFFVCENPVPEVFIDPDNGQPYPADVQVARHTACGPAGTNARIGDLRFNMIPWVEQITGGLLGLGPSSTDPETGEIVQAVANLYGPNLDSWAASAQRIIDVLNGDLKIEDIISGTDVKDYVFANLNPSDPRRPANGPWNGKAALLAPELPLNSSLRPASDFAAKLEAYRVEKHLPLRLEDRRAVVDKLITTNPALESELINAPEVRAMVLGTAPNKLFRTRLDTDPTFYRNFARQVMMGTDPISKAREAMERQVDSKVGCFYGLDYQDDDFVGIAKVKLALFKAKFGDYKTKGHASCGNPSSCNDTEAKALARKDVWDQLRREAWRGVAEHEVGHTVGLTHNFIGSFDALNFHDGYWNLRKETIGVQVGGKRVLPVTGQNLVDAAKPNQHQLDEGISEYQYSTIMDYGARVNSNNKGIGKYDDAAILFAYAGGSEPGWVEVFTQTRSSMTDTYNPIDTDVQGRAIRARGAQVEIPLAQAQHYSPASSFYTDRFHYTTLPFHFAEKNQSFEKALDQGISRMSSRSFKKWTEVEAWYKAIDTELKAFNLGRRDFNTSSYELAPAVVSAVWQKRNAGKPVELQEPVPVEVPYMYCSDYEQGWNAACYTRDEGADMYEITNTWMQRYNQQYLWSNFRGDRYIYTARSAFNAKYGRIIANIPNVYQHWLFNFYWNYDVYRTYYNVTLSAQQVDDILGAGDPMFQNYYTMAVIDSTNFLLQQLVVPSTGYHGKKNGAWSLLPAPKQNYARLNAAQEDKFVNDTKAKGYTDVVYVPRGPGRSMYTVFDSTGYDFFTRVNEAGHFWDQIAALNAITTSDTQFLGVDRGADALRYSIPYYMTFNREIAPMFQSLWMDDRAQIGAKLGKTGMTDVVLQMPTFVRAQDYIVGFDYPPAPATPTDSNGPTTFDKIEGGSTWSSKFYAQVFAMGNFTANFEQEFANFNQVFKLGSGETLSPSDNFQVVSFPTAGVAASLPRDLVGGYLYAALRKVSDPSPTAAIRATAAEGLINRANYLGSKYKDAIGATTKTAVDPDDNNRPVPAAEWEGRLRETVRQLEIMRGLYAVFGSAY